MRRALAAGVVAIGACRPLPPAPMMAMHDDTSAAREGATTATLILGIAGELLGGDGIGVAVRVERQATDTTALGGELTAGRGDVSGGELRHLWLVAARAYGRATNAEITGAHYGLGLARLSSGMVTGTIFGGVALSYPNDYVAPYAQLGLALAVPFIRGEAFGDDHPPRRAVTELFTYADVGALGHIGDTGQRLSLDLGAAIGWRNGATLMALSIADGQRFDP